MLILTARADEVDTVVGLDAGADDYVTKPFRLAELLARARALLRRGTGRGPVRGVDWSESIPKGAGPSSATRSCSSPRRSSSCSGCSSANEGKVVSREQLMREVWDTAWFGSTKTLDMHISVLRRKLGDDATQPRYITTIRGVGFRFDAPDDRLSAVRRQLLRSTMLSVGVAVGVSALPALVAPRLAAGLAQRRGGPTEVARLADVRHPAHSPSWLSSWRSSLAALAAGWSSAAFVPPG